MEPVPVILRCPRGEEWPAGTFKSTVDYKKKVQSHDTIHWLCPAGHEFDLRKAVEKGMFTPDQALRMIAAAQRELPELRKEARRAKRKWKF